jgi:xylulokinase
MYTGAIAQQWAIETFFKGTNDTDVDVYKYASELARQIPLKEDTVVFLPYMRPGGAPYNNMNARGVFTGIGLNHDRQHLFRAVLEGVSFNIRLLLERFEKFRGQDLPSLNIIGGGSRNPFWMQLIADISRRRITTTSLKQEANCFAAAQCAGMGVGVYKDFNEIKALFTIEEEYLPDAGTAEFYDKKFEIFLKAYQGMLESYDLISDLEIFSAEN